MESAQVVKCDDCGALLGADWHFCGGCGSPISCPICNEPRPAGRSFCPNDGHAFLRAGPDPLKACPKCGKFWRVGAKFCYHCGADPSVVPTGVLALAFVSVTGVFHYLYKRFSGLSRGTQAAVLAGSGLLPVVGIAGYELYHEPPIEEPVAVQAPAAAFVAPAPAPLAPAAPVAPPHVIRRAPRARPTCARGTFEKVRGLVVDARTFALDSRFDPLEQQNLAGAAAKGHYALIEDGQFRVRPLYPPSSAGPNSLWWWARYEGKRVEVAGCGFPASYHGGASLQPLSAKVLP